MALPKRRPRRPCFGWDSGEARIASTNESHRAGVCEISPALDGDCCHFPSHNGTDQQTEQCISAASWRIESPYCCDGFTRVLAYLPGGVPQ